MAATGAISTCIIEYWLLLVCQVYQVGGLESVLSLNPPLTGTASAKTMHLTS